MFCSVCRSKTSPVTPVIVASTQYGSTGAPSIRGGRGGDDGFNPVQFVVGAALGGLGGYMDSLYIEPFGVTLGGTLALLQVLDFNDVVKMPWNAEARRYTQVTTATGGGGDTVGEITSFVKSNLGAVTGFAAGYLLGYNALDWSDALSSEMEADAGGGESSSSSE